MEKQFVEELYKEKARNDSNSIDLANTLNILSKTVFGDINRFVFELLQNADDSPNTDATKLLNVTFHLLDNYLIFYHTGKHFDKTDVKGISRVGSLDSQKDKELEKTGYKGIGFKSVFNTSDCVQIISNGFSFKFDKNYHLWANTKTYPWQVIPIWSDSIPQEVSEYINLEYVNTIIKIGNKETIYSEILNVFEDCQIILFLRNINSVSFLRNGKQEFIINKQETEENTYSLFYNGKIRSNWYVSSFNIDINEELRNRLAKLSDEECPVKLKEARRTKMTFAALINEGKLASLDGAIVYNYLPTKVDYSLPYLVNGDFITNAERTQLLINEWNKYLLKAIAYIQLEWLKILNKSKYRDGILRLLKSPYSYFSNSPLKEAFNKGLDEAIGKIEFIPDNTGNQLLKVHSCLVDILEYSKYFPVRHLLTLYSKPLTLVNPSIENKEILLNFGASAFNKENLESLLLSTEFITASQNDHVFNINFIKFLFNIFKNDSKLKNLKFILDNSGQLQSPEHLFFPSDSILDNITFTELSFIDKNVFLELNKHKVIIDWLISLDVKFPKHIEILRKSVFKLIQNQGITEDNYITITRFVFKLFKEGELTDNDYLQLCKIKLLTNNGFVVAPNTYLSDFYNPILKLEHLVPEQNYVLSQYVEYSSDIERWKSFFIRLYVKEKITVVKYDKIERTKLTSIINEAVGYLEWIDRNEYYDAIYHPYKNSGQHSISNFKYFYFLNHLSNYNFSELFWEIVLNDWHNYSLVSLKTKYHHYKGAVEIPDYLSYFVRTHISIPATDNKCYKSVEVYAPRFKSIINDKYPVANFKSSLLTKEQINYIGLKQFLEIDNCVSLLKSLSKAELNSDIKKQCFAIYNEILKSYKDGNRITIDTSHLELLSLANTFKSVENLYYFNVSSLKIPVNSENFILLPDSINTIDQELLCQIFNISIVNYDDLVFNHSDKRHDATLKQKLIKILPFISLIVSHNESEAYDSLYNRLLKQLSSTNIYVADSLSLLYNGKNNKTIFNSQINTWHEGNTFYYSGDWSSPLSIYTLSTLWCSYFGIENVDRELTLFLQISEKEIEKWLSESGYEMPSLPEQTIISYSNNMNIEETTKLEEPTLIDNYSSPLVIEQFVPETEPEEADTINIKVDNVTKETISYNSFSRIHSKLTNDEQKIDIGRWSEEYIFKYLKDKGVFDSVNWLNEVEESYNPYDFIVENKGIKQYIEVKGTPSSDKGEFYLSKYEWQFMFEQKQNYYIYRLFNVGKKEGLELKIISEPYLLIEDGSMLPDTISVYI